MRKPCSHRRRRRRRRPCRRRQCRRAHARRALAADDVDVAVGDGDPKDEQQERRRREGEVANKHQDRLRQKPADAAAAEGKEFFDAIRHSFGRSQQDSSVPFLSCII